jgi:hypothetical protein
MKKQIFLAFVMALAFTSLGKAHASAKSATIFCPLYHAQKLKNKLPAKSTDKFKHCALSCQLALRCSALDTMNLGILKEVWDLFTPGNAEWKDIEADATGIRFAITKQAVSDKECNNSCSNIYWKQ